jgi:putative Mn2+ efflux pump MntP
VNTLTAVLIAIGLAADATAVSMSSGCTIKSLKPKNALLIASAFGIFQMLMPLVGWALGSGFKTVVEGFDHWIAFLLLVLVGGKMIKEAFSHEDKKDFNPLNIKVLLVLAIATSIDALAVGFSMSLVGSAILVPIFIIGGITFALSYAGCYIGRAFGHLFENKVEILGGLILIGIGVKILIEHMSA